MGSGTEQEKGSEPAMLQMMAWTPGSLVRDRHPIILHLPFQVQIQT